MNNSNRNLVVAPCGNSSTLFATNWLNKSADKQFDVCLLFYHPVVNEPVLYKNVEYFYHLKDFKFKMIHELLTVQAPHLLTEYDYFYFLDDDIAIDTKGINKMFELSKAFDAWITQASLSHNSFCSWPIFKNKPNCLLRYVGQVEVMAPLFSLPALQQCLSSFNENKSSWGLDSVWPKMLGYPTDKLAVFDAVIMEHTRPVGGGELYKKIQVDPHDEWNAIAEKYGAIKNNYVEYGRLEFVNKKYNALMFKAYELSEAIDKVKQRLNDLGLQHRIKKRLGIKPTQTA